MSFEQKSESTGANVPFSEAVRVWWRIGWTSFGGPAGQIALMHKELVEKRRWIDEERFLHALNYCMLLPGPEAQQLATYIGWLLHKTRGGLVAGLFFVLPGFLTILGLSAVYAAFRDVRMVSAVFFGVKTAVLAIVIEALLRIGKRALRNGWMVSLSVAAFVSIALFRTPFPWVMLVAGVIGLVTARWKSSQSTDSVSRSEKSQSDSVVSRMQANGELGHTQPSVSRAVRVLLLCAVAWISPIVVCALAFGSRSVFVQEGVFFSRTAVVTFGGAYAVLAYIAQRAVETYGWLRAGEMMDGLGLAETTPGPLIMVVQFVGYLGGYRASTGLSPWLAGVLGASITVWVTFVPCFCWIFLGAPFIESLRGNKSLQGALSAMTAAVVGVIVNLSLWFALHLLFRHVDEKEWGIVRVWMPDVRQIDWGALLLASAAMLAMFRWKIGTEKTLAASVVAGVFWKWLSPNQSGS